MNMNLLTDIFKALDLANELLGIMICEKHWAGQEGGLYGDCGGCPLLEINNDVDKDSDIYALCARTFIEEQRKKLASCRVVFSPEPDEESEDEE